MKKNWLSFVLVCFLTAGIFALYLCPGRTCPAIAAGAKYGTLVIDPGHGGEDGGAVSPSGGIESQINLSVARKLEDILALEGIMPELLRREDVSLHREDAVTIRQKKRSDLRHRVSMIKELSSPILLSIHQNSFPDSRYHGAQTFFAHTNGSRELAEHIQTALAQNIDPENNRRAKPIPDHVYLMNHIDCPAILVECGFLTNPIEDSLLQSEKYQKKLAVVLAGALLTSPITNKIQEIDP